MLYDGHEGFISPHNNVTQFLRTFWPLRHDGIYKSRFFMMMMLIALSADYARCCAL